MFESLVVPVDESAHSARALEVAVALAKRTGARIDLFEVTSPGLDTVDDEASLRDLAAGLGVPVGALEVVEGDSVVDAVTAQQLAHRRSLVVMGTHAHTGAAELFLGGYAGEVVRHAVGPVLLVGPKASVPVSFDVVQVCVDATDEAGAIFGPAGELAMALDARLWVVEVLDAAVAGTPGESNAVVAAATRLRAATGLDVEWEVLHGRDVPAALVDFAAHVHAGVVALATHGRTSAAGRLLGSTAMRVAHDAPVPVLVERAR